MHYNYKKNIKLFVVAVLSLTFLLTNITSAWSALPCVYKCKYGNVFQDHSDDKHKHADDRRELHSNLDSALISSISTDSSNYDSENYCKDYYSDLLSFTNILVSIEIKNTQTASIYSKYLPSIFNHIPDPYRTPPA